MKRHQSDDRMAAVSEPVFEQRLVSAKGELLIRRYPCDSDPAVFGDLAPIKALWQSKCRGGKLPRWQDFSIEEFVGWHRYIALSDIAQGSVDLKYRMVGSALSELVGAEVTGKTMNATFPVSDLDGILQHFTEIRDKKLIGYIAGNLLMPGYEHRRFQAIELPLMKDGTAVEQILHAMLPLAGM